MLKATLDLSPLPKSVFDCWWDQVKQDFSELCEPLGFHKQRLRSFHCAGLKHNKMFPWPVANLHCVFIFSLFICALILSPNKWIWRQSLIVFRNYTFTDFNVLGDLCTWLFWLLCGNLFKTFHFLFLKFNQWPGISDLLGACPSGKHILLIYRPQLMESLAHFW